MVTESHNLEAMESWSLRILGWAVAAAHTCPHHMQDCQDSPTVDMDHPVLGDIAAAALGFDFDRQARSSLSFASSCQSFRVRPCQILIL